MRNKILSIVIGIIALGCFSASAQTVSANQDYPSGFKGINVSDYFSVNVKAADYYGADWTVDSALKNYIHVYVRGNDLVATVDRKAMDKATKKLYAGKKVEQSVLKVVIYAPELNSVVASGNAKVDLSNIDIKADSFSMDVTDDAKVTGLAVNANAATITASKKAVIAEAVVDAGNLSINTMNQAEVTVDQQSKNVSLQVNANSVLSVSGICEKIEVTCQNSGKITIKGEALSMDLGAAGKEVHAEELKVNDVKVVGSNSCKSFIRPSDYLSLDLKGGCTVSFGGKPEIEIINIQNSSVNHLN